MSEPSEIDFNNSSIININNTNVINNNNNNNNNNTNNNESTMSFSVKDHQNSFSPPPTVIPNISETIGNALPSISRNNINSSSGNLILDNNDSLASALQNSNVSSSSPYFSTKTSMNEIIHFAKAPSPSALFFRIVVSWLFGLVCQVVLMLFNPSHPMQFIWGVLCIGCGMTAAFAITWSSLLLKFKITFLITFATTIYWVGTPITWQILYVIDMYPPPIGVFTCIFPFEGLSLVLVVMLIPRLLRNQPGFRKKVITAFSSLIAPYLSFVSGLIYFRLFQFSTNIGRILLPPAYTVIMKIIQLGLDIICVRCAHSGSNLLIIIGRIIASYYSFAVLSFINNPVSVVSVVLSKLGLHIFMSLFMIFPQVETKMMSYLPQSFIGWKTKFEKGNQENNAISTTVDGANIVENPFDKMAMETDPQFTKIHIKGTNLWFSMFSDLLAIIMAVTVYTMGNYGPTKLHYTQMFPFRFDEQLFFNFLKYLGICFISLFIAYGLIWIILNYIIKTLELKRIVSLISVNWYPLNHFYVSCINFMMGYVIVVVAMMPDLFSIPGIDFWNVATKLKKKK
ncbi:hypothetical protein CYY_006855 [Polysphondylium violaceum]|uniref:Transmembrane protein n=1 Tax=Polysphondylium violaceum TaxID=133409 RepID=A0A8J4PPZ4_9MYCE|nr:hypothetical protein CYY_006855 [Polysphondylium violaceum]